MPFILQDGKIDRKAYELCLFSELKRRLDPGDVWVEGAKRFQSFGSFLIPKPTFELMREEGPLPSRPLDALGDGNRRGRLAGDELELRIGQSV